MIIVRVDDHAQHHATEMHLGQLIPSVESPARLQVIERAVHAAGFDDVHDAQCIELSLLERVHSPQYIEFLSTAYERWRAAGYAGDAMAYTWPARHAGQTRPESVVGQLGYHSFSADCSISAGTAGAARNAAAAAATAATHALQVGSAFAMHRPPGHHATRDQFGGYCYLNNAAVAAQRLRDLGAAKVAVLDIDYHHGNGTQDIFYARDDVLTCSIHADPANRFPWFIGYAAERGVGAGEGSNLNLPLPLGSAFDAWRDALHVAIAAIRKAGCDALVVALGVDTFEHDPISDFKLKTEHYPLVGTDIAALQLPTALIMEGGYLTEQLGENVAGVLQGFAQAHRGSSA
ncbi:MAG: histone deacetylase family protein [Pseudomonadota bacterium]